MNNHDSENIKRKDDKILLLRVLIAILIIALIFITGYLGKELMDEKALIERMEDQISELDSNVTNIRTENSDLKISNETLTVMYEELTDSYNNLQNNYEELLDSYKNLQDQSVVVIDKSVDKYVPTGSGRAKSYMAYNQKWSKDTLQSKLHTSVKGNVKYDNNGYATYDNRYFVAVKPYYGDVGDFIDVYQADGSVIPCIIGDNKGSENSNKYIHFDGSIIEFMVGNKFKGVKQTHPEYYQNIIKIANLGSYFDIIKQ